MRSWGPSPACSLYGCGTVGVTAFSCPSLKVVDSEIYQCSLGAVQLFDCDDSVFVNCDIHDMYDGAFRYDISDSENVTVDGEPAVNG